MRIQIIFHHQDTFPAQITQLVFLDGTSQSMLSPRMKKPVPPHHLHSICPLELQDEHTTGFGCCIMNIREIKGEYRIHLIYFSLIAC